MVPSSKGARAVEVVGTGNLYGVSPAEAHSYDALLFREKGGKHDLDNIQERDESISHGVFIPVPLLFVLNVGKSISMYIAGHANITTTPMVSGGCRTPDRAEVLPIRISFNYTGHAASPPP